jgi:uncharacterized membrane protein
MAQPTAIKVMKVVMVLGLILFLLGHYLMSYSPLPETMGVKGLVISAALMAVGVVMSLPTKMYLTFVWVRAENEKKELEKRKQEQTGKQVAVTNDHNHSQS